MNKTFELKGRVEKFAKNNFIKYGQHNISFDLFFRQANTTAQKLKTAGGKENDIIALIGISPEVLPVFLFAIWMNKAIALPLNPKLPKQKIEDILKRCRARFYITDKIPEVKFETSKGLISEDLLSQNPEKTEPALNLNPQIPATIILTSGSSGTPKCAVHTLENHFANAWAVSHYFKVSERDNWLLALPVFHVAGLAVILRAFLAGAALSIPIQGESLDEALKIHKPTHISLVPTQLQRLLESDYTTKVLQECKAIFLGGSVIPKPLIQKSLSLNLNLFLSYGMTELCSTIAIKKIKDGQTGNADILPIHKIKIADDEEVLIKGKSLFQGYFTNGKMENVSDPAGWFHTKDLGRINDTNQLTVLGRKDNMFISGGENIYPEEIEKHLLEIEGIRQAVVVPVKDKEFGFRPVAFVDSRQFLQTLNLKSDLQKTLPSFKIPIAYYPWPQDIYDGIKLNRKKLTDRLENIKDTN
jgi:o-succinylbenzoate---CoA ligase